MNNKFFENKKECSGYPSLDKPWLNTYPEGISEMVYPKKTMYRFIYDSNVTRLDNVAMVYFDKKITYRNMFSKIRKVADAFVANGIKSGDVVSIISLNTPETVYCIYALNMIGAVANLIIATITPEEINELVENTQSKLLLVLDKLLEKYASLECNVPVVVLSVGESAGGITGQMMRASTRKYKQYKSFKDFVNVNEQQLIEVNDANAPAIIVYTSGSTGVPKGVVLSNNNLNSCAWQCSLSGKDYKEYETFLNILPPFFSFGISMLHVCLYSGMAEIICIVPKIETIQAMIKKYRPSRLVLGPAFTDVIEKYKGNDLSFMVEITGGGGAISIEKEKKLNELLAAKNSKSKYLVGYGMTEISAAVSMNFNDRNREQSIGLPLPLTNIKVIDTENGEELGYGKEGELLVSSPGIMLEYYDKTDETRSVIEVSGDERWIHTGDLAKVDEDGYVFITGRLKRIFITKDKENIAYKLFPQRMEEVIDECELVNKCGVIVVPDEARQNVPVVYVTANGASVNKNVKTQVEDIITQKLPSYYLPKEIVVIDEMPISSSQKIDYRELEKIYKKH